MVYLINTSEAQQAYFPKPTKAVAGALHLSIVSTVDHTEIYSADVTDLRTSELYYNISLAIPATTADGEYKYILSIGGKRISSGLVIVGNYKVTTKEFNDIEQQYKQYGDY